MVQEYGEIDLARLLAKHEAGRRAGGGGGSGELDDNFIRLYWQQMLQVGEGGRGCVCVCAGSEGGGRGGGWRHGIQ